jgi:hypothetical protein
MIKTTFVTLSFMFFLQTRLAAQIDQKIQWGSLTNNLQMSLSLSGNPSGIEQGGAIWVAVQLRNQSSNGVFVARNSWRTSPGQDLSFQIMDPSGKDISPAYPQNFELFSTFYFVVQPESENNFKLNLREIKQGEYENNFRQVGTYRIVAVQRGLFKFLNTNKIPVTVTSNPLNIKIIPKK